MEIQPQTTQPISDDQELAKVLAGVSQQTSDLQSDDSSTTSMPTPTLEDSLQDSIPTNTVAAGGVKELELTNINPDAVVETPQVEETAQQPADLQPVMPEPTVPTIPTMTGFDNDNLEGEKKEAIDELRPLMDKIDLPPKEKFDLYLLLIRSTDDKSLIRPAHATAKMIEDESMRAQALLDIIKEIDFLSTPNA